MLKRTQILRRSYGAGYRLRRGLNQVAYAPAHRTLSGSGSRRRPNVEGLEPRALPSGSPASVASLQPYNGQQLSESPQTLVISFNDVPVPALMGSFDVQINELNPDGTKTPLWDFGDAPPEFSDATGTELIVPLEKFSYDDFSYDNITLPAGQYEIDLVGGTSISYAASGAFGAGPQLWDPNQDEPIGTFTILGQGATISPSAPSIVPGVATWGWIDPSNPSEAVDLYKFTLSKGQLWQVGLVISANSIGSNLLTDLSLFNSDGTLIATRNSGTGLPSNPSDPYIFTGLGAGTYYVGVSGAGNVPYSPGGYNPILGIPGLNGMSQPGGLFSLNLIKAPQARATRLLSSSLNYSGSDQNTPTGITLNFSGPIDLSNLFIPDAQETALEVVDSSGQVWPVAARSYEVSDASLSLIFERPLAPGSYSLVSPMGHGLTDLAEQPILAANVSPTVLATWQVSPPAQTPTPNNLGVLWPLSSSQTASADPGSLGQTNQLAPGQAITFSFNIIVPGYHKLTTQMTSGDVVVQLTQNNSTTILYASADQPLNNYLMQLSDGAYTLRFINAGQQSAAFNWQLKIESLDWEKILNNGVSQTSALSLSLFSTASDNSSGNSTADASQTSSTVATFSVSTSTSNFAGSMGPIPNTMMVTSNTGLVGAPALPSQSIPMVGPMVDGGSTVLANSGNSLSPSILYESTLDLANWLEDEERPVNLDQAVVQAAAPSPVLAISPVEQRQGRPEAERATADEQALGQVEWLLRLGARMQGWLTTVAKGTDASPTRKIGQRTDNLVLNRPTSSFGMEPAAEQNKRARSTAQVDLGAATCAIMIGAAAYKLRRPILRWWKAHNRALTTSGERLVSLPHRGPHRRPTRSRAGIHIHKTKGIRAEMYKN